MTHLLYRRSKIAIVILLPVLAALFVAWLESRTWIVLQNVSGEPLAAVRISTAHETWTSGELAPDESRRWQVTRKDVAVAVIEASSVGGASVVEYHPEAGSFTFVRIERDGTARLHTQREPWARWLSW